MSGMNLEKIHYTTWGTESQFFTVWRTLTFFEKPTTEISEDLLPFFFPTHYLIFCSYRYSLLFFSFLIHYLLFLLWSAVVVFVFVLVVGRVPSACCWKNNIIFPCTVAQQSCTLIQSIPTVYRIRIQRKKSDRKYCLSLVHRNHLKYQDQYSFWILLKQVLAGKFCVISWETLL